MENTELSNLARIKQISVEIAKKSTSHGIPNIFKSELRAIKLMWLVCFFGSTGGCAFILYNSIARFLDYEVVTTIKIIDQVPAEFPTVAICNTNFVANDNALNFITKQVITS